MPVKVEIVEVRDIGSWSYRWPHIRERFGRCWEIVARVDGATLRLRHAQGRRRAYGRMRARTVTFLGGEPVVEGVGADDYPRSRALLSLITGPDGRMVRRPADLPPGYDGFLLVDLASEIRAPYTRHGLAAKVREDDLHAWVALAILRARVRSERRSSGPPERPAEGRSSAASHRPKTRSRGPRPSYAPAPPDVRARVARELARFEEELNGPRRRGHVSLTDDPAADRFVRENPLAFLLAVILDQGIPYGRAWRAPLELRGRLGHLDPVRMARHPDAVAEAIRRRPALHRFVNTVSRWIVSACRRVVEDYGGDAAAIWTGAPPADELARRLRTFEGISQKKAAMAVMLLWRSLGVEVTRMERCDVAVDVHVRRVFLRTGLAGRDDPADIVQAARDLWPALPAALDLPAWTVGTRWCHPTCPECGACRLGTVCPRLIDRARGVTGP
ncbi:MAG: hypothetical protein QN155_06090 [Armatimonadota bacterium]|nr:hypothetical protein [Armatimonadota bacterium]